MGWRVLAIDDDRDFLDLLSQGFEQHGHTVVGCETVGGAIAELEESGEFDLVLTDLGLADDGGLALLERLREARPNVPVMVVTGHGEAEAAALALGAAGVLVKPVELSSLLEAAQKIMV
ncbi:MAG: response regulator [Deltaproteobacteria bacterium]|nr:response regulator [Deltaproteobacteria bacterium]